VRVALVTDQSRSGPSTTYRAVQHLPRLRERLGEVDALLAPADVERGQGRVDQARFFASHAIRYVRRGLDLAHVIRGYDAVLVQRGVYPMGPGWAAQALVRFPGRVVYDLDDAIFYPAPVLVDKGAAARWLYGPQQVLRLLARADAVVTSTQELANALPGRTADAVLPTVPDPWLFPRAEQRPELPLRVGWAGTAASLGYLDPLAGVFERLEREGVARLEVVSSEPWRRGPSTFSRWSLDTAPGFFARFDVGVMPMPDTRFTRAKAGFKMLQYMAAGAAVIASPVGVNTELIERSAGGFLATGAAEWEQALRRLAGDVQLRRRLGDRGRAFIEGYADLDAQADTLALLLSG